MSPLTLPERIALRKKGILPSGSISHAEYGHFYGKIGGPARLAKLSKKRRREIAAKANAASVAAAAKRRGGTPSKWSEKWARQKQAAAKRRRALMRTVIAAGCPISERRG